MTEEALCFALGKTSERYKKILSYSLFPTKSFNNWEIVLSVLRDRGIKESLLFVTEDLTEIRDAITNVYLKAILQFYWVHIARNVAHDVSLKDRSEVLNNIKSVYTKIDWSKLRMS